MLDKFRELVKDLGYEVSDGVAADDESGRKVPLVAIKHGAHTIIALEAGKFVEVTYPMDIRPEDTELLAKQPDEILETLYVLLKREMLEGRSGYFLVTDPRRPKALRQIRVSQRLVIREDDSYTRQRIADAVQEIVVTAIRCQLLLGEALRSAGTAAAIAARTYHSEMYR